MLIGIYETKEERFKGYERNVFTQELIDDPRLKKNKFKVFECLCNYRKVLNIAIVHPCRQGKCLEKIKKTIESNS